MKILSKIALMIYIIYVYSFPFALQRRQNDTDSCGALGNFLEIVVAYILLPVPLNR